MLWLDADALVLCFPFILQVARRLVSSPSLSQLEPMPDKRTLLNLVVGEMSKTTVTGESVVQFTSAVRPEVGAADCRNEAVLDKTDKYTRIMHALCMILNCR